MSEQDSMNDSKDLRDKYQLPPEPEQVDKIAHLVEGRDRSSMEEIAKIINTDRLVTQRLINMAFPKAAARKDATVQMATSRLGLARVITLMVGELLSETVLQTFETMFGMTLEIDDPSTLPLWDDGRMIASLKFSGKTNGEVSLGFSSHLSLLIAAQVLGGNIEDDYPRAVIIDAVGEVVNIVTGNLQSRLADAGMPSEIGLPDVVFSSSMPKSTILDGSSDHFFFRYGMHSLAVTLCFSPFSR